MSVPLRVFEEVEVFQLENIQNASFDENGMLLVDGQSLVDDKDVSVERVGNQVTIATRNESRAGTTGVVINNAIGGGGIVIHNPVATSSSSISVSNNCVHVGSTKITFSDNGRSVKITSPDTSSLAISVNGEPVSIRGGETSSRSLERVQRKQTRFKFLWSQGNAVRRIVLIGSASLRVDENCLPMSARFEVIAKNASKIEFGPHAQTFERVQVVCKNAGDATFAQVETRVCDLLAKNAGNIRGLYVAESGDVEAKNAANVLIGASDSASISKTTSNMATCRITRTNSKKRKY